MATDSRDVPPHKPDSSVVHGPGARPEDFTLRLRRHRIRLLAEWLQARLPDPTMIDPPALMDQVPQQEDHALIRAIADLAAPAGLAINDVMQEFERCAALARRQLMAERADPAMQSAG